MAIAFDADSNVASGTGKLSWGHTFASGAKGFIVAVTQLGGAGADQVEKVLCDGVAMTRVKAAQLTTGGEQGVVYLYFLGEGLPTGAKTIEVLVTGNAPKRATGTSVTAATKTEVVASEQLLNDSLANPSFNLAIPEGRAAFVLGALVSGHELASNVTPNGSYTQILEYEGGASFEVGNHVRRTSNSTGGSTSISWTATAENVCAAALAISESADITITAPAATATAGAVGPVPQIELAPPAAASSASAPAPTPGVSLEPPAAASSASAPAPEVGPILTIEAPAAQATAAAPAAEPGISLEPAAAPASASAPAPLVESDTPEYVRIAVRQEYPPDKLAVRIDPPNGAPSRWAADEHLTENVIADLRLVDEMPGGDKEMTGVLARDPRTSWPDLAPYSDVTVYGPGGEVVWQGRLDKAPESDGEHMAISPAAVGGQAALDDDKAMIGPAFIDTDLSKWGEPSTERRKKLVEANVQLAATTATGWQGAGEDLPGILFDFSAVTSDSGTVQAGEVWNDAGGDLIGRILYFYKTLKAYDSSTSSQWLDAALLASDDSASGPFTEGENHHQSTNSSPPAEVASSAKRYAVLKSRHLTGASGSQMNALHGWLAPKLIGDHELPLQGTWPNVGYTVSPMLAHAIPLYTSLTADPEDLEDLGYIIQQAWFSDPGPMSQVVQELTKYELLDWFVRGSRFYLKQPGTYGRRWQAYAGPSGLQEQGLDASRLWREILVTYQDVDGSTRTVGPPGSGAMVEDPGLEITDPDHPAVRAGITRRDRLDLRGISTPARAIEAGEIWLREANQLSRSGSATLSDYAMDDRGIFRPVSQLRAGDLIRFPDAADTSYRKVVRRAHEDVTKTVAADLDAPPDGLQALLERMQAAIQTLALS